MNNIVSYETGSRVLIIIPTYDEVENIDLLHASINAATPHAHILFVDDNSQDGTQEKIDHYCGRFTEQVFVIKRAGKMGLGTAYIEGFKWALVRNYDVIVEMDADLSHDPYRLPGLLAGLKYSDAVIGSRYVDGGGTKNWSFLRKFISMGGSLYSRTILGIKLRDLTGGHNIWKRKVLETMRLDAIKSEGYAFQIELKYRALLLGFKLIELPITFVDRRAGESKMSGSIFLEAILRVWALRGIKKKNLSS